MIAPRYYFSPRLEWSLKKNRVKIRGSIEEIIKERKLQNFVCLFQNEKLWKINLAEKNKSNKF